jgi:putative DNA primase/helicase
MPLDPNVVDFPNTQQRALAEAERLAGLSAADREYQYSGSADRIGIDVATLKKMAEAILKDRVKLVREEQVEARERKAAQARIDKEAARKAKERGKALASIAKLPSDQHEAELVRLAKRLGEDLAAIHYEFDDFCVSEADSEDRSPADWRIEPWPEPVATAALLQVLINKIHKHVVLKPHEALTVALWTMIAWVHNQIAHHSPYLVATSADDSAGKTTLIVETVGRLAPRAYNVGEPTAAIFRFIDREKPSLFVDDADVLFQRKRDLAHIFNVAWTRGVKIPRQVQGQTIWFDPFCPKAVTLIGTNIPRPLYGRGIVIKMWPKTNDEHVEEITGRR